MPKKQISKEMPPNNMMPAFPTKGKGKKGKGKPAPKKGGKKY